ncbi:MAG: MFS transporter [Bifidobacteriaceae bacterium]|jgi:MFS family permease|nr:MFS transporter [Bifidobacteriaceae bacterium]
MKEKALTANDKNIRRVAIAGGVGTALEQFDFVSYGLAAALVFPQVFFPNDADPLVGALKAFIGYAVGFCARPIGGLIFSHFGEKLGRKWVLFGTLALMGSATFLIGCIPSYTIIGQWAAIILFVLRFLQGMGAGAEQAGSATLLTETAKVGTRGRLASSVMIGAAAGVVLGTLIFALLQLVVPESAMVAWGWRIPFLFSILVTGAAFLIRAHIAESPVFEYVKKEASKKYETNKAPVSEAFKYGWRTILKVFFMNWGPNTQSYIVQTFFVTFVTTKVIVGTTSAGESIFFSKPLITNIQLVGAIIGMASSFFWGYISDKIGRKKPTVFIASISIVLPFIYFSFLDSGLTILVAISVFLGYIFAAYGSVGIQMSYFPELFGSKYRYAGMTIARELSSVIGGGIAPLISAALLAATSSWLPVAIYAATTMLFSAIASFISPETLNRDLTIPADAVKGEYKKITS